MVWMKRIALLGAALLVAGCTKTWQTTYDAPLDASLTRGWNVTAINVVVPDALTTTDKDVLFPDADIVWHGDPAGNRKVQAAQIVKTGLSRGASKLRGRRSVKLNVTLQEFHALSPIARLRAPSAVHNISFVIQAVDARSNTPLTEPTVIAAHLEAYTGTMAFDAVAKGQTQKVRITNHLAAVAAGWLGAGPDPRMEFTTVGR